MPATTNQQPDHDDDDRPEEPPQEVTCEGGMRLPQMGAGCG